MKYTESCQVLQDLTQELPSLSHQEVNSGSLSEKHCCYYSCGRKDAAELTYPETAWLGMWQFCCCHSSHIRRRWQLNAAWLHTCCCGPAWTFSQHFCSAEKGEWRGILFCICCFPASDQSSWDATPDFPGMILTRAWRWDVQKGQEPASVRRKGEETEKDLGLATVHNTTIYYK